MSVEHNMPADQYHQHPAVSNSRLSDFLEGADYYEAVHILKTVEPKVTDDMDTGTAFHELCEFGDYRRCAVPPKEVLTSNGQRRGKTWEAFVEENPHKVFITPKQDVIARGMRDSLYRHPRARRLLDIKGTSEVSFFGVDHITGLETRCRVDRLSHGKAIIDFKSVPSVRPKAFATKVLELGYHRQQVFYQRLVEQETGDMLPFVFMCVEKKPPYLVRCYELPPEYLMRAEIEIDDGMRRLAACMESGDWTEPGADDILTLPYPRWAKYDDEWEVAQA